jgi:hypothetical protein
MDTQAADDTGSLSLELTLADGIEVDVVDYYISGNGVDTSGSINVSAAGSSASIEVFGLPPGQGYLIEMQATSTNGEVTCRGLALFDVEVGESTSVMVMLNCRLPADLGGLRVDGKFNICAALRQVVVSPLQTSVGNDIELESVADDEEGDNTIQYQWTATGGSFTDPSAPSTDYTCEEVGEQSVTIEVSDDGFVWCVDSWTINVTCVDGA